MIQPIDTITVYIWTMALQLQLMTAIYVQSNCKSRFCHPMRSTNLAKLIDQNEALVTSADSPSKPEVGSGPALGPAVTALVDGSLKLTAADQDTKTIVGASIETNPASEPVAIGQKIGKYEIRAQLGMGGMGSVFLAFDPLIEREVALKVLSPDLSNSPTALQRFLGEARAIGRLNHSNVVSIWV